MFVGPLSDLPRSRAAQTGNTSSGAGVGAGSASSSNRLSQDCLPRREPLTEVRSTLARIESRSTACLMNPTSISIDRISAAANAAAGGIDADIPLARPLSSIAALSQREAQTFRNNSVFGAVGAGAGVGGVGGVISDSAGGAAAAMMSSSSSRRSEGAMEVFLASLGVDMRETNRMLQYVRAARPSSFGSSGGGFPSTIGGSCGLSAPASPRAGGAAAAPTATSTLDVEAFLKARRAESLGAAIRDVQQAMVHREREQQQHQSSTSMLRASSTETNNNSLSLRGMVADNTPGITPLPGALRSIDSVLGTASSGGAGALLPDSVRFQLNLQDGMERSSRMGDVVAMHPATEWLMRFSSIAEKTQDTVGRGSSGADLLELWQCVRRILYHLPVSVTASKPQTGDQATRQAGAHPLLLAATGSRLSLERNFFQNVIKTIDWHKAVTPETIDPTQIADAIQKYCASGRSVRSNIAISPWATTFYALRCGQWRAGANLAPHPAVASAIRDDPRADVSSSASLSCATTSSDNTHLAVPTHVTQHELRDLYKEEATRKDPFRAMVLFLLLRGRLGASLPAAASTNSNNCGSSGMSAGPALSGEVANELTHLTQQISTFIDDVLWIRLSLVECLSVNPNVPSPAGTPEMHAFHSLRDLQASVLGENPATLFDTFANNNERMANFYFHAILPATACRTLLSSGGASTVDAVHLAVCFYQRGLLAEPSPSPETPLGFESALQSFVVSFVTAKSSQLRTTSSSSSSRGGRNSNNSSSSSSFPSLLHIAYGYFRSLGLKDAFVALCSGDENFASMMFGSLMPNASRAVSLVDETVSAAASNLDLLDLLNDVATKALMKGRTRLAAQVSVIAYAHAAVLGRRNTHQTHHHTAAAAAAAATGGNDERVAQIAKDALSRAYLAISTDVQRAIISALASRCALIQPETEYSVDGVAVRAGTVPIPADVLHIARTVKDVVDSVGPLSVVQSVEGKLARLAENFNVNLGVIDLIAAWDDKDDALVVQIFWSLNCVPATHAQIDATAQMLAVQPEMSIILMARTILLVQHSLQRLHANISNGMMVRTTTSGGGGGDQQQQQQHEQFEFTLARVEAQMELLKTWFSRWPQRCRSAGTGGSTKI